MNDAFEGTASEASPCVVEGGAFVEKHMLVTSSKAFLNGES